MPIKDRDESRSYQKEWARKRRELNRSAIQQYKLDAGCADCGYKEHHAGLEFDHLDNKTANVASLMGQDKKLWEEIEKCEVVCGTCHGIRTYNRLKARSANG